MVVDEGDGDEHEVLLAPLDEGLDGLLSPRLQPGQGANLSRKQNVSIVYSSRCVI